MEAVPVMGKAEYGIEGSYTIRLPKDRYIQFQGIAEALDGDDASPDIYLEIKVKDPEHPGQWIAQKRFLGVPIASEPAKHIYQLDLTEWNGQDVQLCLGMQVHASYI